MWKAVSLLLLAGIFQDALGFLDDPAVADAVTTLKPQTVTELANCSDTPYEVVFVLDSSGSVGQANFTVMKNFVNTVINNLNIGASKTHVGVITFNSYPVMRFRLTDYTDAASLKKAVDAIPYNAGITETNNALDMLNNEGYNGARQGVAKVAIVLTDGNSFHPNATAASALKAQNNGINIFAVGIGNEINLSELSNIASNPDVEHLFRVETFSALQNIVRTISTRTCNVKYIQRTTISPPVITTPTYIDTFKNASQECNETVADILFILDASGSLTEPNFNIVKQFVINIINQLDIGENLTDVGVITFSNYPRLDIKMGQYTDKLSLINAVNVLKYYPGMTATDKALNMARLEGFKGTRPDAPNIAIVVTDGHSTDPELTKPAAQLLKQSGATVFSIGVGLEIDKDELNLISSSPNSEYVFFVSNFTELKKIESGVTKNTCEVPSQITHVSTPPPCVAKVADVVFVIDSSGSVGAANFRIVKNFIKQMINVFDVSQEYTRIGVITYNNAATMQFGLNTHNSSDAVKAAVDKIMFTSGGTNTGLALENLRLTGFNNERPGVPNIAIVITDGLSTDPTATTVQAKLLKNEGDVLIAIGVGKDTNQKELKGIASVDKSGGGDLVYQVGSYEALQTLNKLVARVTCGIQKQTGATLAPTLPWSTPEACVDVIDNCLDYGPSVCSDYKPWAEARCRATCKFCEGGSTTPAPECKNLIPNCKEYGTYICTTVSVIKWTKKNCPLYCNFCNPNNATAATLASTEPTEATSATAAPPSVTQSITPAQTNPLTNSPPTPSSTVPSTSVSPKSPDTETPNTKTTEAPTTPVPTEPPTTEATETPLPDTGTPSIKVTEPPTTVMTETPLPDTGTPSIKVTEPPTTGTTETPLPDTGTPSIKVTEPPTTGTTETPLPDTGTPSIKVTEPPTTGTTETPLPDTGTPSTKPTEAPTTGTTGSPLPDTGAPSTKTTKAPTTGTTEQPEPQTGSPSTKEPSPQTVIITKIVTTEGTETPVTVPGTPSTKPTEAPTTGTTGTPLPDTGAPSTKTTKAPTTGTTEQPEPQTGSPSTKEPSPQTVIITKIVTTEGTETPVTAPGTPSTKPTAAPTTGTPLPDTGAPSTESTKAPTTGTTETPTPETGSPSIKSTEATSTVTTEKPAPQTGSPSTKGTEPTQFPQTVIITKTITTEGTEQTFTTPGQSSSKTTESPTTVTTEKPNLQTGSPSTKGTEPTPTPQTVIITNPITTQKPSTATSIKTTEKLTSSTETPPKTTETPVSATMPPGTKTPEPPVTQPSTETPKTEPQTVIVTEGTPEPPVQVTTDLASPPTIKITSTPGPSSVATNAQVKTDASALPPTGTMPPPKTNETPGTPATMTSAIPQSVQTVATEQSSVGSTVSPQTKATALPQSVSTETVSSLKTSPKTVIIPGTLLTTEKQTVVSETTPNPQTTGTPLEPVTKPSPQTVTVTEPVVTEPTEKPSTSQTEPPASSQTVVVKTETPNPTEPTTVVSTSTEKPIATEPITQSTATTKKPEPITTQTPPPTVIVTISAGTTEKPQTIPTETPVPSQNVTNKVTEGTKPTEQPVIGTSETPSPPPKTTAPIQTTEKPVTKPPQTEATTERPQTVIITQTPLTNSPTPSKIPSTSASSATSTPAITSPIVTETPGTVETSPTPSPPSTASSTTAMLTPSKAHSSLPTVSTGVPTEPSVPITTGTPETPTTLSSQQLCAAKVADLLFVIDSSGSVGMDNFEYVKNFIKQAISTFDVGIDSMRIGLITYNYKPTLEFGLTKYNNSVDLDAAITALQFTAGGTDTGAALETLRRDGFTNDRPGAPNIAIVITDGLSSDPLGTSQQARLAKASGSTLIAIGVGNSTDQNELKDIASTNTKTGKELIFEVSSYGALKSVENTVINLACKVAALTNPPVTTLSTMPSHQTGPTCTDTVNNCADYGRGVCSDYEPWAKAHCTKYCGFCKVPGEVTTPVPCVDNIDNCPEYGTYICTSVNLLAWTKKNCLKYCGLCGDNTPPTKPPTTEATTAEPVCRNKLANCNEYGGKKMCSDSTYSSWAADNCREYCGFCSNFELKKGVTLPDNTTCPDWRLPKDCTLVQADPSCCPLPKCPEGYVLTAKAPNEQ